MMLCSQSEEGRGAVARAPIKISTIRSAANFTSLLTANFHMQFTPLLHII